MTCLIVKWDLWANGKTSGNEVAIREKEKLGGTLVRVPGCVCFLDGRGRGFRTHLERWY